MIENDADIEEEYVLSGSEVEFGSVWQSDFQNKNTQSYGSIKHY